MCFVQAKELASLMIPCWLDGYGELSERPSTSFSPGADHGAGISYSSSALGNVDILKGDSDPLDVVLHNSSVAGVGQAQQASGSNITQPSHTVYTLIRAPVFTALPSSMDSDQEHPAASQSLTTD